jgi:MFS family permease
MVLERRFWPVIALMVLHGTVDSILHLWMARFLGSGAFAARPIGPGYVISGYAVAYVVSRTVLGMIPEDFGRRVFMVIPGLLGGGVMILGILSHNYLLTAGGYVLGAFLWSAEYPAMLSLLAHEQPDRFGAVLSLHQLLCAGAVFLGLNGMGYLVSGLGEASMWKAMLIPACGFPIVGLGAGVWLLLYGNNLRPVKHESAR